MLKAKKVLILTGRIFIILLILLLILAIFIYLNTQSRLKKTYTFQEPELAIPMDSISIAKGKHLYNIRSCGDCHGANLEGSIFMNDKNILQLTAPNLTSGKGGLPASYSVNDWVRVLRHGVDSSGRSLWLMPAHESAVLSKTDLANLIAYCRSVPPVDTDVKKMKKIGPIGRVLIVMDNVAVLPAERIDHSAEFIENSPTELIELGKYLASACAGCHRDNMKGGSPLAPGFPAVPDISFTGKAGNWTSVQFIETIRKGKTPDGRRMRNEFMPWENMKHYSDEELMAIKAYLQSLK